MASGGGEQLPLQRAWECVQMEIRYLGKEVEHLEVTERDLVGKLQFFLSNDKMRKSVLSRLKRKHKTISVQGNNETIVVELQKQMTVQDVMNAFENALKDQVVKQIKFENEQKLSKSLYSLDEQFKGLFYNGTVGLFLYNHHDWVILNIVGPEIDVVDIENIVRVDGGKKELKSSVPESELDQIHFDRERKVYVALHNFDVDTIQYLHVLNFKEQLLKRCKEVKCKENIDDNKTELLLEGRLKQDVSNMNDYLMKMVKTVVKKAVTVSPVALKFLEDERALQYCKEKLKKVQAHIQISTEIIVWAPTEDHFEKAEKYILEGFIDGEDVKGSVEITGEVNEILENSKGKIQLLDIPGDTSDVKCEAVHQVVYLKEMSGMAQRIIDCLQTSLKPNLTQVSVDYEEHVIKYAMASQLDKEINKAFPSVKVAYEVHNRYVTMIAELEKDANDAVKEFHAYAKKIEKVEIKDLTKGMKELLIRDHISSYVAEQFKHSYLLFMYEDEKFVCVGIKFGDRKKFTENVKKYILTTTIRKDFLQLDIGREFLNRYQDRIAVGDESSSKKVCTFCHTKDLQEEITSFVEKCSSDNYYRKKCNPATAEFLKLPDLAIVSEVEKEFEVKIVFENGYIGYRGNYDNGVKASKELEKRIPIDDLVLNNGERYKSLLESEEGKKRLNEITKRKNCYWSMTSQLEGKAEKLDKIMMAGVEHLITWLPSDTRSTVSLVDANFTSAVFDALVVLVDDKLCGQDILKTDGSHQDYGILMKKNMKEPLGLGMWQKFDACKVFASKTVVLVPISRDKTSKGNKLVETLSDKTLKKVLSELFNSIVVSENIKVAFAMPTFNERFLRSMVKGFTESVHNKYEHGQRAHLYICGQQMATLQIEDVDEVIGNVCGTKQTKRIASDNIKDNFDRPSTSVQVEKSSIFDVKAQCLVVLIAKDLDLNSGTLSKKVLQQGGDDLATEVRRQNKKTLELGEFITTGPGKLKNRGVKKVIFGCLPKWKNSNKILQKFVADCMMKADEQKCDSIAFPVLGTGNLQYPPRDAAAAMLDGIEGYVEESMSGRLKTVYITTTDDTMHKILTNEQSIRDDLNASCKGAIPDDAEILIANDRRINYSVVKESQLLTTSGKYVTVRFMPKKEVGTKEYQSNWKLLIGCGKTEKDLKKAVRHMVKYCEEDFVTGVNVHCSRDLPMSFADQSQMIIATTYDACAVDKYPNRFYNYLSNITIVAEDEAAFSNIETGLLQWKLYYSIFGAQRTWRKEKQLKQHSVVRIKLIAEKDEDIKTVKADIQHYLYSTDDSQGVVATQDNDGEETSHFKSVKPVQEEHTKSSSLTEGDIQTNQVTDSQQLDTQRECLQSDVSAELNRGIVKYLKSLENGYSKWLKQVEEAFDVHITEVGDNGELLMNVAGSFESILGFEEYLEKTFPEPPNENQPNEMESDADSFALPDDQVAIEIQITKDQKTSLIVFYDKEIQDLIRREILYRLKTQSDNSMTLTCKKNQEGYVKSQFKIFHESIYQIHDKKMHFGSIEVMKKAETACLLQLPDDIRYVKDNVGLEIRIMGMNKKALDDLEKRISRIEAEAYEEHDDIGKDFDIGKARVYIHKRDILETKVECIVSSGGVVAQCIADAAGKKYKDNVEKSIKNRDLKFCECRSSGPGYLKSFKNIIHVNCSFKPDNYSHWQGLQMVQESVQNCLYEADEKGMRSVALPFLCSGGSAYKIEDCAKQYIRAIYIASPKLKKLREIHLVDKASGSVTEVCKLIDTFLEMKRNDSEGLSSFKKQSIFSIENSTVNFCKGNIKLSIAQGIAIFVDKHSQPSSNKVINSIDSLYEGGTFQEMLKSARSDDKLLLFPANKSLMQNVVLVACLDVVNENRMEKEMFHAVKIVLERADKSGIVSLALSIPEFRKATCLQEFSRGIVDFFHSHKGETSLKYIVIVGTVYNNVDKVFNDVDKYNKPKKDTRSRRTYWNADSGVAFEDQYSCGYFV